MKNPKSFRLVFGIAVAAIGLGSSASLGGPVSVDGIIGAEWTGITSVIVTHDASAPIGNFQASTNLTTGPSYTIQVRDDGSYYYVALQATTNDLSAGDFANLYFDTNPPAGDGSDVGFEVTNNRYFIAGIPGYIDATPYLTFNASNTGTIELAIANSFFTSGPLAGTAYPNGYPAATGDVVLRLSQTFSYSVAGGDSYGPTRLGSASVAGAPVPLPASVGVGFSMLAGFGAMFAFRRQLSRNARIA